jgi:hypothetical protein
MCYPASQAKKRRAALSFEALVYDATGDIDQCAARV